MTNPADPNAQAYPITITLAYLENFRACAAGVEVFKQVAESRGDAETLTIADVLDHMSLLATPLAEFEAWALGEGLLPPVRYAGGDCAFVTGGDYATVTGGYEATVSGGDFATVTGGVRAIVTGGDRATVTGGDGATVTGGDWATVSGGDGAELRLSYWDDRSRTLIRYVYWNGRRRTLVGYVGETLDKDGNVLKPGVAYRCALVDGKAKWVRA